MYELLRSVWRYRGFVVSAILNDLRSRYARSRFGLAWVVLQPIAQVLIFSTVLSSVLAAKLQGIDNRYAYAAYLISGILCWSFFADIVQRQLTLFIDNSAILKKINFPRMTLPLISVGGALVNNLALLVVLLAVLPILGFTPGWQWLWLLPLSALTILFGTGLGLLLGVFNVFVRDVAQVTSVVLQFWFWMTPVVYPVAILPEAFRPYTAFNPMFSLVTAYSDVLVYGRQPQASLWPVLLISLILIVMAWFIFRRASSEIVDAL